MLSIPDLTEHVTKHADWFELSALRAPDGRIGFGTLVSAADLEIEEQEPDIADEDLRQEGMVIAVQAEIAQRLKVIGPDYPFVVDESGAGMQMAGAITPVGAIYLFCLFLSHAYDRTIIPESLKPDIDHNARDLFQVCATVAAAGVVQGIATSFGWPRPDEARFLDAVKRIYGLFGDGTPHVHPPAGAPEQVKDDGIDVIAWQPSADGLPGTTNYLLGQAASGKDWRGKSVVTYITAFHQFWFSRQPASLPHPAMFMPFCIESKGGDDAALTQENLAGLMQKLTAQFGLIVYRYRMAHYAARGLQGREDDGHLVERADDLPQVEQWVQAVSYTHLTLPTNREV